MAKPRRSPTRREWGPTGVVKRFPPRLSRENRKRIEDELRRSDVHLRDAEPLLDGIASAIGLYDSSRHLREISRPAAVRENLRTAFEAAEKLNERLNALDGNSCWLIKEAVDVDKLSLQRNLRPLLQALFAALQLAEDYPDKGNLPENERLYLAADVLDVFKSHLGERAHKALEEGCYEAVLEVVLEEAFQKRRADIESITRNLVDQVLRADQATSSQEKIRSKRPDGVVEYRRPQRRSSDA